MSEYTCQKCRKKIELKELEQLTIKFFNDYTYKYDRVSLCYDCIDKTGIFIVNTLKERLEIVLGWLIKEAKQ